MRFSLAITALGAFTTGVKADLCALGSIEIAGNWYCQAVNAIKYAPVGVPGEYKQITEMAPNGVCSSTSKSFSGPLAPLDEEVSLHFRGPIHLKQFAVYTPSLSTKHKKRDASTAHARRHGINHEHSHGHKRLHKRDPEQEVAEQVEERGADMVVATIDGVVVSWTNNYFGPSATASTTRAPVVQNAAVAASASATSSRNSSATGSQASAASASKTASSTASASSGVDSSGSYTRVGYYNATSQTLDGMVFLGNHGGAGSGVFDTTYGSSLAYVASDGKTGASSAQVLGDGVVPSDNEFIIMSDTPCVDGSCGYVRPGSVAYHGFGGADKIFLAELMMPTDNSGAANIDMPAFWMLNAQIPRTLQYGEATCSCWTSGCGEFDILEVLSPGSNKCKSTFHMNVSGGDSDYFVRPTTSTIKVAVVFRSTDATAHILLLDDSTDFSTSITAAQVEQWCDTTIIDNILSTFALSS